MRRTHILMLTCFKGTLLKHETQNDRCVRVSGKVCHVCNATHSITRASIALRRRFLFIADTNVTQHNSTLTAKLFTITPPTDEGESISVNTSNIFWDHSTRFAKFFYFAVYWLKWAIGSFFLLAVIIIMFIMFLVCTIENNNFFLSCQKLVVSTYRWHAGKNNGSAQTFRDKKLTLACYNVHYSI
jgi:hypothetical protein